MASQKLKELEQEYIRLNHLAGQTTNELDHKSLMALIESFDLYVQKELLDDSILIYKKTATSWKTYQP